MNKKIVVLLTVIAMLSVPFVVSAQTPGGPFNTAFRVQNLSPDTAADCVYVFYDANGVAKYTSASSSINPGDSLFVYTPNLTLDSGSYSGVVSCSQDVAAIVNYSDPDSGSAYAGVGNADLAKTLFAPAIYNNYYNYYTNIFVQNASGGPVNMGVAFYAPGSSTPAATQFKSGVPDNATWTFSQSGLAGLGQNVSYSAVITATGNVGAFINIFGGVGTPANNQLYSYNAVKGGSSPAYAPVIMNGYYGYNTAMTIQNLGGASTTYTVTYGTSQIQTGTLTANSSVALYTPSSGVPSGQSTGATVTSDGQPLVLLVNESNNYNRADSYIGFSSGNTIARAPIVYKSYYNYNTSVTCQNLGGLPTSMTITYANNATHPTVSSEAVDPGKTYLFYQPTDPNMLSGDSLGGTSATITGTQSIACIVNEDTNMPPFSTQFLDNLYTYSSISR